MSELGSAPEPSAPGAPVGRAVAGSLNAAEILMRASGAPGAEVLRVPLSAVMVYEPDRGILRMIPGSFGIDEPTAARHQVSVGDLRSHSARVFATGQPYFSNDLERDPAIGTDWVRKFGIRCLLSVPLRTGRRGVGVMHLANKVPAFEIDDVVAAEALGPRIAIAVESSLASVRLQIERQIERILSGVAFAVACGRGLQEFVPPALEGLTDAADAAVVAAVFNGGSPIVCRSADSDPELERRLVEDARGEPSLTRLVHHSGSPGDAGSAVLQVPVVLRLRRIGTICALRNRPEPFVDEVESGFTRLAQLAALAWATERYQQQRAALARLEERERIARQLHHDLRSLLFAAERQLGAAVALDHAGSSSSELARARLAVIRGEMALGKVVDHMSSRARVELPLRLRAVIAAVQDEFPLDVVLDVAPDASELVRRSRPTTADVLVKVGREALVNAAKHAGPCQVLVRLDVPRPDALRLIVEDDGVGLASGRASGSRGLRFLHQAVRDHGGRMQVRSAPRGGTRVVASVPLWG